METTLERLRDRAEEVVRRAPSVEAVVLFGSRARGTAGPGSDWDVALIEKSGHVPEAAYRRFDALPGVRLLGFRSGEIEHHKNTAGALEAALARQGVTLAGAWRRPECRREALSMEVVRIRAHLANATDQMDKAGLKGGGLPPVENAGGEVPLHESAEDEVSRQRPSGGWPLLAAKPGTAGTFAKTSIAAGTL